MREYVNDAGKKKCSSDLEKMVIKMVMRKMLEIKKKSLENNLIQDLKDCGQGEATITNNTNRLNIVSPSVSAARKSFDNNDLPTDPLMPDLEDFTGIFRGANDDEDVGAEADLNNLETTMNQAEKNKSQRLSYLLVFLFSLSNRTQKGDPSWIEAMQEELLQFKLQKVWTLSEKGKLVAQGYTQEEGIDYDEVFAHVARIEAIMLFLAYASFMGFIVYQMDVKSAFLYGTIEEEVAWYETLSTYLIENGFRRGTIDKTLFIKKDKGDILLVQVYVDDIIFGSTKKSLCDEFEQMMHKKFQMSSMGELTFFLGLQVQQKKDGIFISQDKYVVDILKKFDFITVKTASTPMEPNKALVKDEEADSVDVQVYTLKTHILIAVKRIFRYLKGQPKLGLWYPRDSPFDLEAFSDSDYAGASLDRKSTTGGCQFLSKRLISWQCKKQTIVANSTTEAEYVAAANCCGQTEANIEQILPSPSIYQRKHRKTQKHRRAKKVTELPQTSVPLDLGADEAVHKEGTTAMPNVDIPLGMDTGGSPRRQETMGGAPAQTRSERVLKQPNEPPLSEGHTSGSGEGRMEHTFELMDIIPPTPLVSSSRYPQTKEKSQETRKIEEVKHLTPKKEDIQADSDFDDLNDLVDEGMAFVQEKDAENQGKIGVDDTEAVNTAGEGVSTASVPETVSTAAPRTPPTTTTVFDDEDVTMAIA
ncbi:putative ribonuclease H-like domain-containing protein [Tanacetum coccineum]|uniref:Ribonuclease H-like domain-containing protein n=1 Tax=Tanacetum coccineum TaxID=301880 RepID=A0ABQ5FQZ4_9ASTR